MENSATTITGARLFRSYFFWHHKGDQGGRLYWRCVQVICTEELVNNLVQAILTNGDGDVRTQIHSD